MVSPSTLTEVQQCLDILTKIAVDSTAYTGQLEDIVFDITTADTYIAGIATSLLDGDPVEVWARTWASKPLLTDGRWWHLQNGQLFDLQGHPEVQQLAASIERLRVKCEEAMKHPVVA